MSEALRLAEAYADAVATHRLESLYGTSKSYTLEKSRERDEAHESIAAELRRLSAELENVRKDAERYRWLRDDAYGYFWINHGGCYPRRGLDAAIDAAMKGTQ